MHQLVEDEDPCFARGSLTLRRDVYMDDVLTEAATLAEDLQRQLPGIIASGFPLKKWAANHKALLFDISEEDRAQLDPRAWRQG